LMDTSSAEATVKLDAPLRDPIAAVTVLEPAALAVAMPEADTWTAADDDVHVTEPVRS